MKIVIIGPAHPLRGGIAAYNERLALSLQNEGHDVSIYTFTLQYPNFLFPGKTQYTDDPKPEHLQIKEAINSINPLNWISVGKEIKKLQADLIITRFWIPFMGPCLGTVVKFARAKSTKVICIADNVIPHESKIGDKLLTSYFVKNIDGFVTMSHSVTKDLDTFDSHKPRTFNPHPIYDHYGDVLPQSKALEALNLSSDYSYLLFFGLIRDYKGLDLLLNAMSHERIKNENIKLIIAGEYYSNKDKYHEQIEKLNLRDKIIEVDHYIPDSEVGLYFNACDLLVQPYKTATQSGVTQIAYHFNKPMIVTNVGGLGEICPDRKVGYLVEPTPESIAIGIVKYFHHTNHEKMQEDILDFKKQFSWESLTKNIFELYRSI